MIGREIATERDLVPARTVDTARSDLRRTGLSGDPDNIRMNRLTGPFLHDSQQHIFYQRQCMIRADRRVDHLRGKTLHGLAVM